MAEQKSPLSAKIPPPPPTAKSPPQQRALGDAAASTDPAVQQLLARRDIADRIGDTDGATAVNIELAKLGVA